MVGYRVRGRSRPANRLAAFAQELQQLGWTMGVVYRSTNDGRGPTSIANARPVLFERT